MVATRASKKARHDSTLTAPKVKAMGFMQLSREIRDLVYGYALIADNNIEIFRADLVTENRRQKIVHDPDATAKSIKNIAAHLIRVNRTIHEEAAPILYSRNVFAFVGEHDWKLEIEWLTAIGPSNRRWLGVLQTTLREPTYVYQYADGSRRMISDGFLPKGELCQPNPLIQLPLSGYARTADGRWKQGALFEVDPNWENLFRLLGDNAAGGAPRIQLRIQNGFAGTPGAMGCPEDQGGEELWYGMNVPNVLEKWRENHSKPANANGRQIDMVWRCQRWAVDGLDRFFKELHDAGWDLLDKPEWPYPEEGPGDRHSEEGPELLTMRHRPITGPIYSDGPNPYGGFSWDPLEE